MTAATESSGKTTHNCTSEACGAVTLAALGVLRARGADALAFLQGQLSNDMTRLSPERSLLAGYHNPQGRVIALMRLLQLAPDDVLAILPRELLASVLPRLSRFILRAKVKLTDESAAWAVHGVVPAPQVSQASAFTATLPQAPEAAASIQGSMAVRMRLEPARWLLITPASQPMPALKACRRLSEETWRALAVAAGEPQVYAATSEEFVAQMLNLDALGAIAFDKGCYTGQEVIARAHYRGRVKRRLQRFRTHAAAQLQPGTAGTLADGRSFKVVEGVRLADGRCEFLAVAALPAEAPGQIDPAAVGVLPAEQLELPYALSE
jgi:hypothetical protein